MSVARKEISANTALFLKNGGKITICKPGPTPRIVGNPIVGNKYSTFQRGAKRVGLNIDNGN